MSIPTVILVDQKGTVVSMSARGKELGKQLEKLLGPVEKDAETEEGDAAEAPEKKQ
jgi:hypothetical protein